MAYLEECKADVDDPGPLHDCIVWRGGIGGGCGDKGREEEVKEKERWWAAVDTAEDGDLSEAIAMTDFDEVGRRVMGIFVMYQIEANSLVYLADGLFVFVVCFQVLCNSRFERAKLPQEQSKVEQVYRRRCANEQNVLIFRVVLLRTRKPK